MANLEIDFANDFIDDKGRFAAKHFIRTRLGNQIDVIDISVQLHPVGDWLLDAPVDAGDCGREFVTRHEPRLYKTETGIGPSGLKNYSAITLAARHAQPIEMFEQWNRIFARNAGEFFECA